MEAAQLRAMVEGFDPAGHVDVDGLLESLDMSTDVARELGWSLAASEVDPAEATRIRARVFDEFGRRLEACECWREAAILAASQGRPDLARRDLEHALATLGPDGALELRAELLDGRAVQAAAAAAADTSECWLDLAAVVETSDPDAAARALVLANSTSLVGRSATLLPRAVAVGGDESGWARHAEAALLLHDDRFAEAEVVVAEALRLARARGDRRLEAMATLTMSATRAFRCDLEGAIPMQRGGVALARLAGDARAVDQGAFNLVLMLHDDLRGEEAARELADLMTTRRLGARPGLILEAETAAIQLATAHGELGEAARRAGLQLRALETTHVEHFVRVMAMANCARALVDRGAVQGDPSVDRLLDQLRTFAVADEAGWLAAMVTMLEATRLEDAGDHAAAANLLAQLDLGENVMLAAEVAVALSRAGFAAGDDASLERSGVLLAGDAPPARLPRIARRQLEALHAARDGDLGPLRDVAAEWSRRGRPIEGGRLLAAAAARVASTEGVALARLALRVLGPAGATAATATLRAQVQLDARAGRELDAADAPLFEGVDPVVRDALLRHAVEVRRPAGSVLHEPADCLDSLWILRAGRTRLSMVTEDDRRLTLELAEAGAVLGEHALLGRPTVGVLAEVEADVTYASIPLRHVEAAMGSCRRLDANLRQLVGRRAEHGRELAARVAFWTVERRLARCLLELDAACGRDTLDGHRVLDRPFTHFQLAELVSARRETVGELLKAMRAGGVVETRRRCIALVDQAALERLAGGAVAR
ncbi:MAG: cyclic nucleotide-binding protein [Thermoleophilia bacterium]|nr:cyclic nucleotide-binding protein [Thermoleophilia bacterium]